MITGVRFCINHSARIQKLDLKEATLYFKSGYNVLIGPNGSGKSTVLKAIASCDLCKVDRDDTDEVHYITTEVLNPLLGGTFSSLEEMVQGVRAMFLSYGQGVRDGLLHRSHAGETVVLIDSPETGQDHENSVLIHEGLLEMAEHYQVIVATNSLVFMRGGHVIDLGEDYLSTLVASTAKLVNSFEAL